MGQVQVPPVVERVMVRVIVVNNPIIVERGGGGRSSSSPFGGLPVAAGAVDRARGVRVLRLAWGRPFHAERGGRRPACVHARGFGAAAR